MVHLNAGRIGGYVLHPSKGHVWAGPGQAEFAVVIRKRPA